MIIKDMDKNKRLCMISAIVAVALVAYAAYILIGMNADVLITAQDRNIIANDSLARPFGFFQCIGEWLTQFFFYPALGASMLIIIWGAIFVAGIKAFGLKGVWRSLMIVPLACLLTATVDLGYWIYCLNIHGYWFSQSVALLCILLLLWAANATPRRFRIAWYVVIGFGLFPVFGWFSYLFVVCLALASSSNNGGEENNLKALRPKDLIIDVAGVVVAIVAPIVFHTLLFSKIPSNEIFIAGFPVFKTFTDFSLRPSMPFFIIVGTMAVLSFGRRFPQVKKIPAPMAYLAVGLVSGIIVWTSMFKDDNYRYEMQMTQAAMNDDWRGVIQVAEQTRRPSRTMVMLKNIALMNTGELGTRSFELGNNGVEINNPDSLHVNIMQIASPIIYYNYGKINYALRWATEFAISYGYSPYYIKNLARCAETTGEKKLAKRHTTLLNRQLFYGDWKPAPASAIVKELQTSFLDALDSDDNSCELYLPALFSKARKADSKLISELSLFYSMILRNPERFSSAFYDYAKLCPEDYVPVDYEEAYCLFVDKNPDKFPYRVQVSPATMENYRKFWDNGNRYAEYGYDLEGLADVMFNEWGGTYWWYNAFGRKTY